MCGWYRYLQCLSHLTDWPELEKSSVVNIDNDHQSPKLSKVWEDHYYQVSVDMATALNSPSTLRVPSTGQCTVPLARKVRLACMLILGWLIK